MRWFLDMCIIVFYSREGEDIKIKNSKRFVNNKKDDKFILCHLIIEDNIPKWKKRQRTVINEVVKKINNPNYNIGESNESKILYDKDKNEAKQLYIQSTKTDAKKFIANIKKIYIILENRIDFFIKNLIDLKVIPIKEIDIDLRSNLGSVIKNHSDSGVIASGIQEHNKQNLVMLTGDKEHWTRQNIDIAMDSRLEKRYPKIPEIKYIQDFDYVGNF